MASTGDSAASSRAVLACKTLQQQKTGVVTTAQDTDYEFEKDRSWSQTCWLPAACFVRPQMTTEVAAVLTTLRKANTKFAIRSTGHHSIPNFSSVDGSGVVIDLRDIKSLSLDEDGTVHVGGGSTWGDVYEFLEERGCSVIGARNLTVGVGGFTLGGGMSAFPNIHGLPADTVKNYEVVLGDSSVVNANADTNPDLWRALKGGGTNFGIVTRFDLETYPLIKSKYAVNLYDPTDYVNILKATVQVQESMESDPKIGLFVSFNPTFVSVGLLYAETPADIPAAFKPFLDLKSLVQAAVPWTDGTVLSLVRSIQFQPPPSRRTQSMTTTKVSLDLYIKSHELYLEARKHSKADLFYTIQPLSSSAVQKGEDKGGNTMGIDKVAQDLWVASGSWQDPSLDEQAVEEVDNLRVAVEQLAKASGDHLDFVFMNDAGPKQTVIESYGPENLRRMRDVSDKYDPERVFQTLQNGGNLLRNIKGT